jgi:uncharacterized repeat protein (TIGR01451 family)
MKKVSLFGGATVTSIVVTTVIATPVLACYPQGKIVKTVQDNTTNSAAIHNTSSSPLTVDQGDTLTYTVTVSNQETQEGDQHQADMTNVVMTDALPAGVQLVGDPSETTITENLGTIPANGKISREYKVTVTATQDGTELTNKACYTSESNLGKNYNESNCDYAYVKVHVPAVPPTTPTAPTTPTTPTTPATTLPDTGSTALSTSIFVGGATVVAYILNVLRLKLRSSN